MKKVGTGTRTLNFIVDSFLILLLAYTTYKIQNWYVYYYRTHYFKFGWHFFGVLFVYYTFFESIFARTPGKWLTYSKVVNLKNGKPGFWQVVLRSAVRIILVDLFFMPFLDKTLHDYLSKTEVVEI
jgi:uncharacterized RDD family membrane protein YckC